MPIIPRPLNIDSIYSKGFDAVALTREHMLLLRSVIDDMEWVPDPEGMFNAIPSWKTPEENSFGCKADKELSHNRSSLALAPPKLLESAKLLINSESLMGTWMLGFDFEVKFISAWDGAEPLDWHWDGPANADFFFLIYLNDKAGWAPGKGGHLMTGLRDLSGNYLKTSDSVVTTIETIPPAQRTVVCCNNQNPRFVHKVVALNGKHQRKVLMIGFDALATLKGERI